MAASVALLRSRIPGHRYLEQAHHIQETLHWTMPGELLFPNFGLIRPINITTRSRTFSQSSTVEVERDADASNKLQIPNISRCHVALSGHNGKMYQFHRSRTPVLAAAVSRHKVMIIAVSVYNW